MSVPMASAKGPLDKCPKCGQGKFDSYQYIWNGDFPVARTGCVNCPAQEHLHVSCEKCGYTYRMATADTPPPEEPPAEPPAEG